MYSIPGKVVDKLSDCHGDVLIFDDGVRRYLSFNGEQEQSAMLLQEPDLLLHDYNRTMILVLLLCRPKSVLMLGLGGGSIAKCLLKHFEIDVTVVELREKVIEAAKKYFHVTPQPHLHIVHEDALSYLGQLEPGRQEVIFSDLYIPEGFDARQLTDRYLASAAKALAPNGWLVVNSLEEYRTSRLLPELFGKHFNSWCEGITADGNWVILATKANRKIETDKLMASAKGLSRQLGFSLSGHLKRLA